MVSPGTGRRGAQPTRSIFRLPTTTILEVIWIKPEVRSKKSRNHPVAITQRFFESRENL
jgi:hypothetical protein